MPGEHYGTIGNTWRVWGETVTSRSVPVVPASGREVKGGSGVVASVARGRLVSAGREKKIDVLGQGVVFGTCMDNMKHFEVCSPSPFAPPPPPGKRRLRGGGNF